MSKVIFLLLLLSPTPRFADIFGKDYEQAVHFYETHKNEIVLEAIEHQSDAHFLAAIVFPEWVRYSYFKDFFETQSLELAYVEFGKSAADFSIGQCQMKPSFVEKLEAEVAKNDLLKTEFSHILLTGNDKEQRQQRVHQLQKFSSQMMYLSCFVRIMEIKFADKSFTSDADKLRFYAAAYNSSWEKNADEIEAQMKKASFPYGTKVSPSLQYKYAEVAAEFYNTLE